MTSALLAPAARRDVLNALRWIEKDNPSAAANFRVKICEVAELIGRHAFVGAVRPELLPIKYRFVTLTGFPYVTVYDAERSIPLIIRVLHGARDFPEVLRVLPPKH